MNEAIYKLLQDRYFLSGESTWKDLSRRVGNIHPEATQLIEDMKFIPSTPTLMNANTNGKRKGTLSSCFTMGIEDSIDGIFDALKEAAIVTKNSGGIGYNFSKLRSSKETVNSLDGRSSTGPLPFIDMFNSMLDGIRQGGARRGAGMCMLDVDHKNILDFIEAKKNWKTEKFSRFNFSIRIPNWFYDTLEHEPNAPMIVKNVTNDNTSVLTDDKGNIVTVKQLWDKIVYYAWFAAEPGIFNSDIAFRQCTTTNYSTDVLCNPCCLVGDTFIMTENGSMQIKDIAELSLADQLDLKVMSYDIETETFDYEYIDKCWLAKKDADVVRVVLDNDVQLTMTGDHNVLTETGWKFARDLNSNDSIVSYYQNENVREVIVLSTKEDVYDISTPKNRNFVANGVVVHNSEYVNIAYSSCNLGSLNISKYVVDSKFEYEQLKNDVKIATKFLDSVIDKNVFPIDKIRDTTLAIRPIGLGVMGIAHALYKLGIAYNSDEGKKFVSDLMFMITTESMKTSMDLAEEFGSYPAFDLTTYWKANERFFNNMDENTRDYFWNRLYTKGIRNSTQTSCAPTGSISFIADCSGGIEPVFALAYSRKIEKERDSEGKLNYDVVFISDPIFEKFLDDKYPEHKIEILKSVTSNKGSCKNAPYLTQEEKKVFVTAYDMKPVEHLDILEATAKYTSMSVSKCVSKDTIIKTKNGLKIINSLSDNRIEDTFVDINDEIVNMHGEFEKCKSFYYNGVKKCKTIILDNGISFTATTNHKILIRNVWTSMKDIKVGQFL